MGRNRSALCWLAIMFLFMSVSGCGSSRSVPPEAAVNSLTFEELGALYRARLKNNLPPPRSLKDFTTKTKGLSPALRGIYRGDIVVIWGAGMSTDSDAGSKVLAYEKQTPKLSGVVLMQDGTFKKMTAQELSAAPKADETK
jgi:hypothetical protein